VSKKPTDVTFIDLGQSHTVLRIVEDLLVIIRLEAALSFFFIFIYFILLS